MHVALEYHAITSHRQKRESNYRNREEYSIIKTTKLTEEQQNRIFCISYSLKVEGNSKDV